ncbi:MAG TPA: hypothetical protein VMW43_12415 [Bacteroidota bacterium]|nr:hypothetical protein [Bacteroidota bacterium]
MSRFSRILISSSFALLAFAGGCRVSRQTLYPEFVSRKPALGPLTVLTDCMLIQGLRSDTSKIDVPDNKQLAVELLGACRDKLTSRGYTVDRTMLTSVGLLMNQRQPYRVVFTSDDRWVKDKDLPVASAPFYLDKSLAGNGNFQAALASLYANILNVGQRDDTAKLYIPSAAVVGTAVGSGTLVVLLAGGMNVPITKVALQTTRNPDRNEAVVAVDPVSTASVMFYIIDVKSGEVLWEDRVFRTGRSVQHDKISDMLADILDQIP